MWKQRVISAGFKTLRMTGLHKALADPGLGFILTLHRVRPFVSSTPDYAPNQLLEVTPAFFDAALSRIKARGFEFVDLTEAMRRLQFGGAPFCAVTFDDGYCDTRDFALPILERHAVPVTVFFAIGLIEGTAQLWWLELEEAIRRFDSVEMTTKGVKVRYPARTPQQKMRAYHHIYWDLRAKPQAELLETAARLAEQAGLAGERLAHFLSWPEVEALCQHPLVTPGAHSLTHSRLALLPQDEAWEEIFESKAVLEVKLKRPVTSFAYPVGDPTSAGAREFALAKQAGYEVAVTTRPGMLFRDHAHSPRALPRVSLNGLFQDLDFLDILLTGAPFRLWNGVRRVVSKL